MDLNHNETFINLVSKTFLNEKHVSFYDKFPKHCIQHYQDGLSTYINGQDKSVKSGNRDVSNLVIINIINEILTLKWLLLNGYAQPLLRKQNILITKDEYGDPDESAWHEELRQFCSKRLAGYCSFLTASLDDELIQIIHQLEPTSALAMMISFEDRAPNVIYDDEQFCNNMEKFIVHSLHQFKKADESQSNISHTEDSLSVEQNEENTKEGKDSNKLTSMQFFIIVIVVLLLNWYHDPDFLKNSNDTSTSKKTLEISDTDAKELCASYIGHLFGRSPSIISTELIKRDSGLFIKADYVRKSDNTRWENVCHIANNTITWAGIFDGKIGRWRFEDDANIYFNQASNKFEIRYKN